MFLINEEQKNETIHISDEMLEKEIETLTEDNVNFIFKQETYFKKQTKKGLIRFAIFTVISLIIAVVSLVQFKNYNNLSNISHIFFVINLGMVISLFLSLEEIPTAYIKHKLSSVKISTIIGSILFIIVAVLFGIASYSVVLEQPPENRMFFTVIMIGIFTFSPLMISTIQLIGLIVSYITRTTKKIVKIVNVLVSIILILLSYLFIFYFSEILTDSMYLLYAIMLILIQVILFVLNIYIFNKFGKSEIIITPLRLIWITEKKVDYFRFREIVRIEFGETKAIITLVSGIIDVKELNLAHTEETNKVKIAKLSKITQIYLTKARESMKLEKSDANE